VLSDLFKVKTKHFQSIAGAAVSAERSIRHFGLSTDILCVSHLWPVGGIEPIAAQRMN
jgi:alkyl sulfatase BDS1-like metallo-beta-lactamase superfamily hydrolase